MYGMKKDDNYLPGGAYDSSVRPVRRGKMRKYIFSAVILFAIYYFFFRADETKIESNKSSTVAKPAEVENDPSLSPVTDNVPKGQVNKSPAKSTVTPPGVATEAHAAANPGPTDKATSESNDPKEIVESLLNNNKIVIFSKSYCPFCKAAKKIFSDKSAKFSVFEIDLKKEQGSKVHEYLKTKYTQKTVPYIFINKKLIGGSDALSELETEKKLDALIL